MIPINKTCLICKDPILDDLYKVKWVLNNKYYCCQLCYFNISYGYT